MDDTTFREKADALTFQRAVESVMTRFALQGKKLLPPKHAHNKPTFAPCPKILTEDVLRQGKALIAIHVNLLRNTASNFEIFLAVLHELTPMMNDSIFARSELRDYFCCNISWSLPNREALLKIKNFVGEETVYEVAAGNALWSAFLQQMGVKIFASDTEHYSDSFTRVQQQSYAEVCDTRNPQALLISWGRKEDIDLSLYQGKKLIIIGESYGGCTLNLPVYFFNDEYRLIGESFGFELKSTTTISRWNGIYDTLFCYSRS